MIEVRKADAPLGAEIAGVDLAKALGDAEFRAIERAFVENAVVVFRDQAIDEAQHVAFSRRFGALEIHVLTQYLVPGHPEILLISNVVENGHQIGIADAGQYWHTDLSWAAAPSRCSLLYAREVPVLGGTPLGDTLFASTCAAYDALDPSMKERLVGLKARHRYGDRYKTMSEAGRSERAPLTEVQKRATPDVIHPVIRTHPISGRKSLYVNEGFTVAIEGLPEAESSALLAELFRHATRPEFIYRHRWRAGDLLMWDNCSTQHKAVADYALPLRRLMHRTTVQGSVPV